VDFLKEACGEDLFRESAAILILTIRKSFTEFMRKSKPVKMTVKVVWSFMRFLFERRTFSLATVATYKSALLKPLLWALGLDLAKTIFHDFYRGLLNMRPSKSYSAPKWNLN